MKPSATDRAAALMIDAEKRGCDTPTEGMIADAIAEAEGDMASRCRSVLLRYGFPDAAGVLERWEARNHLDEE